MSDPFAVAAATLAKPAAAEPSVTLAAAAVALAATAIALAALRVDLTPQWRELGRVTLRLAEERRLRRRAEQHDAK